MNTYIRHFLTLGCAVVLPIHGFAQGQEVDSDLDTQEVNDPTPEPERKRSRLYFVDRPIEVESEFDDSIAWPIQPPELAPEDDPEYAMRMDSIRQYNETVQSIELEGGAWDRQLVEELAAMGELQQQQGDHLSAIDTFDRVVHISRISQGLHTLDQIPAIEQKIESYLALGEWEQADLFYNYLFYVQQKAYGNSDPRIIPVLGRLANWNLRAFNIGFGEGLGLRLSSAQILYEAASQMVDAHFGRQDQRFIDYQQSIANSAYLIHRHPQLMNDINRPEFRLAQDALRNKLYSNQQAPARGFQSGQEALLNIVNQRRVEAEFSMALVEAIANLADWYLIFERRRAAAQFYAEAWQLLNAQENSEELLSEFFGHVVPLPTFLDAPTSLVFKPGDARDTADLRVGFAELAFDVTENGVVRNVEVVSGETEENSVMLGRLRREIRGSVFRPVIKDGVAIRTSGNQFRYRYWY